MEKVKEKFKAFWAKLKPILGKVPKAIYIILLIVLTGLIVWFATRPKEEAPYAVLFTELNSADASMIMTQLESMGITDYRYENGNTIMVPSEQENMLKAKLLMAGYPKSGFAYESYYEHVNALSTEAERNRAALIGLEDKMRAVIQCFEGVKDAQVSINPGEDNSYVLDSGNIVEASASVMVTMKNDEKMPRNIASAIQNLVAHSVKGLDIDEVFISDSLGNHFDGGEEGAVSGEASQLKLQLEEEYNDKIRNSVMQVLVPFFGAENVRVGVNCTVDVSQYTESAHHVFLPEWAQDGSTDGEGIIGSKVWDTGMTKETGGETGGAVGTTSNSDLPTYVEEEMETDGSEKTVAASGQIDYNNPTSETQTVRMAGFLTDCMVSVSVNSKVAGNLDIPVMRAHVARAAGITDELAASKISILPMTFYTEEKEDSILPPVVTPEKTSIPPWVLIAAGAGLLVFLIILFIVIAIIKRRKRKKAQAEAALLAEQMEAALAQAGQPPVDGADVMDLKTEKGMELRQNIRKFVDESPEIAAQMIKSWLRGGNEDG